MDENLNEQDKPLEDNPLQRKQDELAAKRELERSQRELKRKLKEKRLLEEKKKQKLIFDNEEKEKVKEFKRNRDKDKIEFGDGRTTSMEELKQIIAMLLAEAREYIPIFRNEYYDQMRKLTGFKKDEKNPNYKPHIFAIYTIKYAYGRFNLKELIRVLQDKNPFLPGLNVRNFKHFQLLGDSHHVSLKGFIEDMIVVMKTCKKWHQFESKYSKMYHLAFPDDLFDAQ